MVPKEFWEWPEKYTNYMVHITLINFISKLQDNWNFLLKKLFLSVLFSLSVSMFSIFTFSPG